MAEVTLPKGAVRLHQMKTPALILQAKLWNSAFTYELKGGPFREGLNKFIELNQ